MNFKFSALILVLSIVFLTACNKDTPNPVDNSPKLVFRFHFDSTQARLDGFGNPSVMAANHWGQSPVFNSMSAHYIELTPTATTLFGKGAIIYIAAETYAGGDTAIDFSQSKKVGEGDSFFTIPLKQVPAGTYQYLRVSLAYQNYTVTMHMDSNVVYGGNTYPVSLDAPTTVASFIGFNSYITNYLIKTKSITVNGSKKQGYWGTETHVVYPTYGVDQYVTNTGQAPGTTVVNPLPNSPIPAGSCVVTGGFPAGSPLVITGNETKDITVQVSLSTNKSFEWVDANGNHLWEPLKGETPTDMGIRGMLPSIK